MTEFNEKHFSEYCHGQPYEETMNTHLFTVNHLCDVLKHCLGSVSDEWLYGERTFLDAGCAMGHVISGMIQNGIDAYGYDSSQYAIDNLLPDVQDRVWFGNHDAVLPIFDDNEFDIVFANGFQYSKDEDEILRWLQHAHRICSTVMIMVIITEDTKDHDIFRWTEEMQIMRSNDWWTSITRLAGFHKTIWTPWPVAVCIKEDEDEQKIRGSI